MPQPGSTTPSDQVVAESSTATIDRLTRALDEWRGRIDELLVRADVAGMEAHPLFAMVNPPVTEVTANRCEATLVLLTFTV